MSGGNCPGRTCPGGGGGGYVLEPVFFTSVTVVGGSNYCYFCSQTNVQMYSILINYLAINN